ncbi:MAG: phosphoribosyltransferase [Candidatus Thermoplasmatota archaeon]|jgi:hypoxanthine phosphoribosyltransferase|nr:phosphoribosyltransferase [Candidatus Thermoplasmatota archaeon]MCL5983543.1 phosphoribosyltransferase [Candidatus Thermoplasmatota archaeon]
MVDFPRCRVSTWEDVDRWADRVGEQILAAGRRPDTIVGLTRGGWVPARLLADRLGVKRVYSLRAQHWGVTATPSGKAEVTEGPSGPVEGQQVLVVDDITDTGESLELALARVREGRPARAETAAFLHISHSKFRPDYFGEEIPKESWVWVVFPWNYWEDLASLAERARGVDPDRVRAVLRERCGWDVPPQDLDELARWNARP